MRSGRDEAGLVRKVGVWWDKSDGIKARKLSLRSDSCDRGRLRARQTHICVQALVIKGLA